jgi:hypothetical protein
MGHDLEGRRLWVQMQDFLPVLGRAGSRRRYLRLSAGSFASRGGGINGVEVAEIDIGRTPASTFTLMERP